MYKVHWKSYMKNFDRSKALSDQYDQYSMNIQYDPIDHIYVVTVPELPGCRTHGKTYEEAVRQGRDAIASWIDDALASGDPIPPPRVMIRS
jgi:predicted RNase H-like HicB family nuclease